MYAYIKGVVTLVQPDRAVLEAGGVGYELIASQNSLRQLAEGEITALYTHLHLAEGVMALYGFYDTAEREMFRKLLSVSRVGPKLAMSVLSNMTPSDVEAAVITENAAAFDRVPGMGRKTAQRVLLELREHVSAVEAAGAAGTLQQEGDVRKEAVAALVSLGYDGLSASRAVTKVKDAEDVETLLKAALKNLAKA